MRVDKSEMTLCSSGLNAADQAPWAPRSGARRATRSRARRETLRPHSRNFSSRTAAAVRGRVFGARVRGKEREKEIRPLVHPAVSPARSPRLDLICPRECQMIASHDLHCDAIPPAKHSLIMHPRGHGVRQVLG